MKAAAAIIAIVVMCALLANAQTAPPNTDGTTTKPATEPNANSRWEEYKITSGKTYATGTEERMRFDNFVANTATAAHKLSDQSAAEREFFKHSALSKIDKTTKPANMATAARYSADHNPLAAFDMKKFSDPDECSAHNDNATACLAV